MVNESSDNKIVQPLSIAKQIECLEWMRGQVEAVGNDGLCTFLHRWLLGNIDDLLIVENRAFHKFIPLFMWINALKFNAFELPTFAYWWKIEPYDKTNRLAFIDWILSELEKQLPTSDLETYKPKYKIKKED